MRLWIFIVVGTWALLFGDAFVAYAQSVWPQQVARSAQNKPSVDVISPGRAKAMAVKQYGGKALSAQLHKAGTSQAYYRVKILKGSQFRIVNIPAVE